MLLQLVVDERQARRHDGPGLLAEPRFESVDPEPPRGVVRQPDEDRKHLCGPFA